MHLGLLYYSSSPTSDSIHVKLMDVNMGSRSHSYSLVLKLIISCLVQDLIMLYI